MATEKAGPRFGGDSGSTSTYVTQSLYLAQYLSARGYPLQVRLQASTSTARCDFVFPYSEAVEADANGYYRGEVAIAPKNLERARKEVARRMAEAKGRGQQ